MKIEVLEIAGKEAAFRAMRFPIDGAAKNDDYKLAGMLINRGDDHAKAMRGIIVWCELEFHVDWMIELLTYKIGVQDLMDIQDLSTSSSMHNELKDLTGEELVKKKRADLPTKVYRRIIMVSYQALRNIYIARRKHRHPDWQIFCDWIETLPDFDTLIMPKRRVL